MRHHKGTWYHQGKAYATCREALRAAWPRKALDNQIAAFIEATRDKDGAYTFVYLPDRGVLVNLDTCTDLPLLNAALDRLSAELEETFRQLAKVERVKTLLEVAQ